MHAIGKSFGAFLVACVRPGIYLPYCIGIGHMRGCEWGRRPAHDGLAKILLGGYDQVKKGKEHDRVAVVVSVDQVVVVLVHERLYFTYYRTQLHFFFIYLFIYLENLFADLFLIWKMFFFFFWFLTKLKENAGSRHWGEWLVGCHLPYGVRICVVRAGECGRCPTWVENF